MDDDEQLPKKYQFFSLYFGKENCIFLATRSFLWHKICKKCDSGRGFTPDPTGGAHDAPPDPLVGWGGDTPPHTPSHSALLAPRSSCPPWHQILSPPLFNVKLRLWLSYHHLVKIAYVRYHSGNVSSSSDNGDIAFLREWSNFDHS